MIGCVRARIQAVLWAGSTPDSGDNELMCLPKAFTQRAEFAEAVEQIARKLAPDVVRIVTKLDYDWTGERAAFVTVVLTDEAITKDRVRQTVSRVSEAVHWELEPIEQWGVFPYLTYRSLSEQERLDQAIPA